MKVTLPDKVTGARDALFVLEVEFPVASAERVVEVDASGPVEPLDLSGSSRGGTYRIPVGLERLHVPMRVLEDGDGDAKVTVSCTEGPESGTSEEFAVKLEAGTMSGGPRWGRLGGVAVAVLLVAAVAFGITKLDLFGGSDEVVPDLAGLSNEAALKKLEDAGLLADVRYDVHEDEALHGHVIRTVPAAGEPIPDTKSVEVILGKPDDLITRVPALVGALEEDAIDSLRAARYREVVNYDDAEADEEPGTVTAQSPEEGTALPKGAQVEIWVARIAAGGPSELPMPPDPGPGVAQLPDPPPIEPGPSDLPDPPPVEPGPIDVPQPPPVDPGPGPTDIPAPPPADPGPTEVPADVQPLVPDADGMMTIPDMRGWDRKRAENELRAAGLVPILTLESPPTADLVNKVIRQRPVGGERRGGAAMIFLTVGDGPPLEPDPVPADPGPMDVPQPPDPGPTDVPQPPDPGPVDVPQPPDPGPVDVPLPPDPGPADVPQPLPPDPGPTELPQPPGPGPAEVPMPPEAGPVAPAPGPTPEPPSSYRPDEPRPVPDVVGEPREKAEGLIRQSGFLYHVVLKVTEYPRDGTVLGQDPAPGVSLPPGGEVVLEVAKAPADARIVVPQVVGVERDVAERMLREAGFLVNVTLGGGALSEQGLVLDQAPRGETYAPRRSWIEIVVASGSGMRRTARGGPPNAGSVAGQPAPPPATSSGLERPSTTGEGPARVPPSTPRGPTPLPPVDLPPRDAPKSASVPQATGQNAPTAIAAVLAAGLIPIIEVDRNASQAPGTVTRQAPAAGTGALPGDLVRLAVAAGDAGGRSVNLPTTVGALVPTAQRMFARTNTPYDIVTVRVPSHPYAGTGRIAAQYPVSRMPASQVGRVTIWVVAR